MSEEEKEIVQEYYKGQIYYVAPTEVVGCEQSEGRPGVIVSNDVGNQYSNVVEMVFLTTREKPPLPTHVSIKSAKHPSIALCEQIKTIDKSRLGDCVGSVSPAELENLDRAMMVSLGIKTTLRGTKALDLWRRMMESNDYLQKEEITEGGSMEPEYENERTTVAEEDKGLADSEKAYLEVSPIYVRAVAERDVYKELYLNLLEKVKDV